MTRYDAVNYIAHGVAKDPAFGEERPVTGTPDFGETLDEPEAEEKDSALAKYCVDLNAKAREGDIDPLIGRDHEVERCIQVLCRRRKNSRARPPKCCQRPQSIRSTWARCWPEPAIAAISKSG